MCIFLLKRCRFIVMESYNAKLSTFTKDKQINKIRTYKHTTSCVLNMTFAYISLLRRNNNNSSSQSSQWNGIWEDRHYITNHNINFVFRWEDCFLFFWCLFLIVLHSQLIKSCSSSWYAGKYILYKHRLQLY